MTYINEVSKVHLSPYTEAQGAIVSCCDFFSVNRADVAASLNLTLNVNVSPLFSD